MTIDQASEKQRNRFDLPVQACNKEGVTWNPQDDIWNIGTIHVGKDISFKSAKQILHPSLFEYLKLVAVDFCEKYSFSHSRNSIQRFTHLAKKTFDTTPIATITSQAILQFRSTLNRKTEHYLGGLRGFLLFWGNSGIPGIDEDALSLLKELRLRGNIKGEAILTKDNNRGPFSKIEYESITKDIYHHLSNQTISLEEFLLVWIFCAYGPRAIQIAALKCVDLEEHSSKDQIPVFVLRIPRAKQRHQVPRTEFTPRPIKLKFGQLLKQYIKEIEKRYDYLHTPSGDLPLFPNPSNYTSEITKYHSSSRDISARLKSILSRTSVQSERTNSKLTITPTRFRRTLGTRAAAEGASELVIAELLDHSDTQNVGVYVQSTPEMIERIDRAIADQIGPIVKAFKGTVVNGAKKMKDGILLSSIISTSQSLSKPVGNCGCSGTCTALAPVACYSCKNFYPWQEGPHELVLGSLLEQRDQILNESGDLTIASVNDMQIFACAEVVKLCQASQIGSTRL